eukprot:g24887.t1
MDSKDVGRCSRTVGWGHIYPEFFGQVSSASAFLRHCAGPRFRKDFRSFERPHYAIVLAALSLIVLVSLLQITRTAFRSCRSRNSRDLRGLEHSHSTMSVGGVKLKGHVPIMPKEAKLRGGHRFELHSSRIRTEEEAFSAVSVVRKKQGGGGVQGDF